MVGDGLPDVRLARALGARAIAAAWGYVTPDRLAAEKPDALARTPEEPPASSRLTAVSPATRRCPGA